MAVARSWPLMMMTIATRVALAQPSATPPDPTPSPGYVGVLAGYEIDQKFLKGFLGLEGLLPLRDDLSLHAVAGTGEFGQIDAAGGRYATFRFGIENGICGWRRNSCPVFGVDAGYEMLRPDPYDTPITGDFLMVYGRIGWVRQGDHVQFGAVALVEAGFGRDHEQPIAAEAATTRWGGVVGAGLALRLGFRF